MSAVAKRGLAALVAAGLCLAGGLLLPRARGRAVVPLPEQPGYVLSGYNVGSGFSRNALTLFDARTMRVARRVPLPRSWAKHLARDPQGRLWIGFSGDQQKTDNRVQVRAPDGRLIKELRTGDGPEAGISFSEGRAFVACAESGFSGSITVVDLATLKVVRSIPLSRPGGRPLLLVASAADSGTLIVTGQSSGADAKSAYSVATLIDPGTLAVTAQVELGPNTDVWRILPHGGRFYLLNTASSRQPRARANDVLVLQPASPPVVTSLALAPSPTWGCIAGSALYAYHNPTWNSTSGEPARRISRMDLTTRQTRVWDLPENWDAGDLAVLDGKVLLARWGAGTGTDGLYRFDPESGKLSLELEVDDASRILCP